MLLETPRRTDPRSPPTEKQRGKVIKKGKNKERCWSGEVPLWSRLRPPGLSTAELKEWKTQTCEREKRNTKTASILGKSEKSHEDPRQRHQAREKNRGGGVGRQTLGQNSALPFLMEREKKSELGVPGKSPRRQKDDLLAGMANSGEARKGRPSSLADAEKRRNRSNQRWRSRRTPSSSWSSRTDRDTSECRSGTGEHEKTGCVLWSFAELEKRHSGVRLCMSRQRLRERKASITPLHQSSSFPDELLFHHLRND